MYATIFGRRVPINEIIGYRWDYEPFCKQWSYVADVRIFNGMAITSLWIGDLHYVEEV